MRMPLVYLAFLLLLAFAGVACDPTPARSTLATLHRDAFLGHPVTCNAEPFVDVMPMPTELGTLLDCYGWYEWPDERALQLDVVRFGTIAVAHPTDAFELRYAPPMHPYLPEVLEVRIDRTLKGSAPLGTHRVTVARGIHADLEPVADPEHTALRKFEEPVRTGGRSRMGYFERGLLFIPSDRVDDPTFLGCLGGHFAKPDAFRPRLLEDYDMLTRLMAEHRVESLRDRSPEDPRLKPLVDTGGSTVGYFVAEFFGWRTSLALLERVMMKEQAVSPLELGLVEGMIRMQTLHRIPHYPSPAWHDLDDEALSARLLDWAIQRIPDLPPKERIVAKDTMTDRGRVVAAWITNTSYAMAPGLSRDQLASTDDDIDMALTLIPLLRSDWGVTDGYDASVDDLERLVRGDPPRLRPLPPDWFTSPRLCRRSNLSSLPLTWIREAFGGVPW